MLALLLGVALAASSGHRHQSLRSVMHHKVRLHHAQPVATTTAVVAATSVAVGAATITTTPAAVAAPAVAPTKIRPNLGGQADVVQFAILTKDFFGVDFKRGTFTVDLVLSLKWNDNRTAVLVPAGQQAVTISQQQASAQMWMPDIAITNRQQGGIEVISTAIKVSSGGEVQKVQRVLAAVKNSYDSRAFPFDNQDMRVRVASTVLMADDLTLSPMADPGLSGVKDGIFEGKEYKLIGTESRSFVQQDGFLKKSRGELIIKVSRRSEAYFRSLIVPELVLMVICYTTFHFPILLPFIMPRVATAMIAFLSLMMLSLRTGSMLPATGTLTWVDVFEEACQMCMFFMLLYNIMVEVVAFELERMALARRFQLELQIGIPVMIVITVLVCFLRTDGEWLMGIAIFNRVLVFIAAVGYFGWCGWRLHQAKAFTPRGNTKN